MSAWWPSDEERNRNRGQIWKSITKRENTANWYGPMTTLPDMYKSRGSPGSTLAKRIYRVGQMPAPAWAQEYYDPIMKVAGKARDDPTGIKRTAKKGEKGILYITPEPYKDDVEAFFYYGKVGLLDPTNPSDAYGISKMFGLSYPVSLGLAIIGGFFFWGAIGWFFDPKDKREEVGGWRSEWYDKWMNPDNYNLPAGF